MFGEIPTTNTDRSFGYNANKVRAIHVNGPLYIQATNDAYLIVKADCYTKTEVDNSLALKQGVINNVLGTGERLFDTNFLKRIFAVAPLQVKHI